MKLTQRRSKTEGKILFDFGKIKKEVTELNSKQTNVM